MNYASSAPTRQPVPVVPDDDIAGLPSEPETSRPGDQTLAHLRLLWAHRYPLLRVAVYAMVASTLIAFLIPARYESTARLMPPDNQSGSGLASAVSAMVGGSNGLGGSGGLGGLAGMATDVLGLKSSSEIFVGILSSRTVQDKLIEQFDLKKVYWNRRMADARKDLASHTNLSVDRKNQIISITVTDKNPRRAAAMTQAYVE